MTAPSFPHRSARKDWRSFRKTIFGSAHHRKISPPAASGFCRTIGSARTSPGMGGVFSRRITRFPRCSPLFAKRQRRDAPSPPVSRFLVHFCEGGGVALDAEKLGALLALGYQF